LSSLVNFNKHRCVVGAFCFTYIYIYIYKVRVFHIHTMKANRGSRGLAPHVLHLSHKMKLGGQLHALTVLPLGRNPVTHQVGGWVGLQSWSGHFGEEKNLLFLSGFEPQAVQPTDFHSIT
jgi:hypothetical protein